MKKFSLFLCATMLVFWIAGSAFATSFTETWQDDTKYAGGTGAYMQAGHSIDPDTGAKINDWVEVEFDFLWDWQEVFSSSGSVANFYQSADVEYASYDWKTGWVDLKFWSGDSADEDVSLNITSYFSVNTQIFGEYDLDDLTALAGSYWTVRLYLDSDQLAAWSEDPWGKVRIEATNGNFLLTSVSMTLEPVPEPATMLLLGSGLFGLAGFRRKLKK